MKHKIIVVIVDEQYDFCKGGALEVPGATEAVAGTCRFLEQHCNDIERVVLTADWHPTNHCSFKQCGGMWPRHCVQFSHGAAFSQELLDTLARLSVPYTVSTKGKHSGTEEYGAFTRQQRRFAGREVWMMGLAGDYCVIESALNLLRSKPSSLVLYGPGIGCIDADAFAARLASEKTIHSELSYIEHE